MTARLFSPADIDPCRDAWPNSRTSNQSFSSSRSTAPAVLAKTGWPKLTKSSANKLTGVWQALVESLPQGVLVLTPDLTLIYANHQAQEICQHLATAAGLTTLPPMVFNICHRFLQEEMHHEPLVVEVLRAEIWLERHKYDLTERESEIWILLRQEYTYLEIAELLQISANTVKTHVKHIYNKRRSRLHQKTFWASR